MDQWLFNSIEQVQELRARIVKDTNDNVDVILRQEKGIELLKKMKFEQSGYDPLLVKKTNFIEMVNQIFTYLVCLAAVEKLLLLHPTQSFKVNFGVRAGHDIESVDDSIVCECFAATSPDSNKKLEVDASKVYNNKVAAMRYVIFSTSTQKPVHVENIKAKYKGVEIIPLESL